jgi:hypothetical protein
MKSVHPIWVVFLAASISFAASSPTVFTTDSATNHHAKHPDKCKHDNLVKCFFKHPALASPFCSSYISLPVVTVMIQTSSTMQVSPCTSKTLADIQLEILLHQQLSIMKQLPALHQSKREQKIFIDALLEKGQNDCLQLAHA